jgi:hypothetical protein
MYYIDGDPFTFCNMAIVILGLAGIVVELILQYRIRRAPKSKFVPGPQISLGGPEINSW